MDVPQGGQGTARPRFHRHPGQTQRRPLVASSRLAGTEGEQLDGLIAKTQPPQKLVQTVQRQIVIRRQNKSVIQIAGELPV
jgi:hypothetical protein